MFIEYKEIVFSIAQALTESNPNAIYLEMGIYKGETFNTIAPLFKDAYAVDSFLDSLNYIKRNKNLKWFPQITDEFIAQLDDNIKFDMVFIDADHRHEQSLKDFIGIAPHVKDNGLILLHDTHPPNEEYMSPNFCGDTYKTAWYIRQNLREDFEIVTIPYYFGISIVRKTKKQISWLG